MDAHVGENVIDILDCTDSSLAIKETHAALCVVFSGPHRTGKRGARCHCSTPVQIIVFSNSVDCNLQRNPCLFLTFFRGQVDRQTSSATSEEIQKVVCLACA